jgi:hypothetical protein
MQNKLDTSCEKNASYQITQDNKKKLQAKWQKEPEDTIDDTSVCMRPERVNKWPIFMIAS